jgi:hypothetical protein
MRNSDPPIQADRLAGVNRAFDTPNNSLGEISRARQRSTTRVDAIAFFPLSYFLYLLEGQTEDLAQLALAHSKVCNRFERIVEPIFLSTAVRRIRIPCASKIESCMIVIVFTPINPQLAQEKERLRKAALARSRHPRPASSCRCAVPIVTGTSPAAPRLGGASILPLLMRDRNRTRILSCPSAEIHVRHISMTVGSPLKTPNIGRGQHR